MHNAYILERTMNSYAELKQALMEKRCQVPFPHMLQ